MATVLSIASTGLYSGYTTRIWILFFAIVAIVAIVVVVLIVLKLIRNGNLSNAPRETSCPKCGKIVSKDKNFCTSCGTKIE